MGDAILTPDEIESLEITRGLQKIEKLEKYNKRKGKTTPIGSNQRIANFRVIFNTLQDVREYLDNNKTNDQFRNNFENCLFNFDLVFSMETLSGLLESEWMVRTSFNNAHFAGTVYFDGIGFWDSFSCINACFMHSVSFISVKISTTMQISFDNSQFNGSAEFREVTFERCDGLSFDEVVFNGLSFELCPTFKTPVFFCNTIFNNYCNLSRAVFSHKVLFHNAQFNIDSVNRKFLDNTKFEALVDFYSAHFFGDTCFYKTDFKGTTVFANAEFEGKAIFLYSQLEKNMILRDTKFKMGVNFALMNFIEKGFLNTFLVDVADFNVDPKYCGTPNKWEKDDYLKNNITSEYKQETFRILKHESLKLNSHIEAINFFKCEMSAFEDELLGRKDERKLKIPISDWFLGIGMRIPLFGGIFEFIRDLFIALKNRQVKSTAWDRLTLVFNKHSSGHGIDQGRSILFVVLSTLLFYGLFLFTLQHADGVPLVTSWTCDDIGKTLKYGFQFFNVTNWKYEPFEQQDWSWAYFPLVLGRIVISFGIYQTIQAFRKFGRKI